MWYIGLHFLICIDPFVLGIDLVRDFSLSSGVLMCLEKTETNIVNTQVSLQPCQSNKDGICPLLSRSLLNDCQLHFKSLCPFIHFNWLQLHCFVKSGSSRTCFCGAALKFLVCLWPEGVAWILESHHYLNDIWYHNCKIRFELAPISLPCKLHWPQSKCHASAHPSILTVLLRRGTL